MVLCAAVMHACWNTLLKIGDDRLLVMAVLTVISGTLGLVLLGFGEWPAAPSWPYIIASALLNNVYFLFLIKAYEITDLSVAYPLARGSAPLLVAGGAAVFAGEMLNGGEFIGVALVSLGIISLMWGAFSRLEDWKSIVFPLATGAMIATYTVVDGIGVRLSGSPAGFIGWLLVFSALPIGMVAWHRRQGRIEGFLRRQWRSLLIAGALDFGAYGLAIWALSLGAMVQVSALRETSVLFAAYIGTRLLGEPLGVQRMFAALLVVTGIVLLHTMT